MKENKNKGKEKKKKMHLLWFTVYNIIIIIILTYWV